MAGVKLTGEEFNEFTTCDLWGEDWYWDETRFRLNGVEVDDIGEVQPTDEIVLLEGTIFKGYEVQAEAIDALVFARKWLKQRHLTTLIVTVPKDQVDSFKAEMKVKGYKVTV